MTSKHFNSASGLVRLNPARSTPMDSLRSGAGGLARVSGTTRFNPVRKRLNPIERDVTDEHVSYLDRKFRTGGMPSRHSRPASDRLTSLERELMVNLPLETSLGFISEPLWFSPALRRLNKPQLSALHKLVRRGKLRVVHRYGEGPEDYVLTKA